MHRMSPLALTDAQLEIVLAMAVPLPLASRSHFLEVVAAVVPAIGSGDGAVALACCFAQRQHFRPLRQKARRSTAAL
jgi:hypothetical protein